MEPWPRKYQPNSISSVRGQDRALEQLRQFVEGFRSSRKKAILLYGPPGCGKTSSVAALAREKGLELMEMNASDFRNREKIEAIAGSSSRQMSLFAKGKIILVDEIDGLSGTQDRGGIAAIAKMAENSSFPVVMTSNNPWDKKFSALRKISVMVEFHHLPHPTVKAVLKEISCREGLKLSDDAISRLARRTGGDLRGAINDLQSISMLGPEPDLEMLSHRDMKNTIIEALLKVLKSTDPLVALSAYDNIEEDYDNVMLWLDANLPKEYLKPKELAAAYEMLSMADVFSGRIRRWQHWRFLVYIRQFLSAGVALSKKDKYKGFIKYMPTKRILKIWQAKMRYQKRKAIAEKIAERTHTSARNALRSSLPFYRQIMRNSSKMSEGLADELGLDADEAGWMLR